MPREDLSTGPERAPEGRTFIAIDHLLPALSRPRTARVIDGGLERLTPQPPDDGGSIGGRKKMRTYSDSTSSRCLWTPFLRSMAAVLDFETIKVWCRAAHP